MKLKHIDTIVLVNNIEVSKKFYLETLGLEILHDWNVMIVFKNRFSIFQAKDLLPTENTTNFIEPGLQGRNNTIIYFECAELEVFFNNLKNAGIEIVHGIVSLPHQRIFRVYDPDRHIIEIGEPF